MTVAMLTCEVDIQEVFVLFKKVQTILMGMPLVLPGGSAEQTAAEVSSMFGSVS